MTKIKFNIKSIYFVVCNTTRQHVYMKVPILKGHIKFHSEWDQEVMTAKKKKKIKKVGLSQCCTNSVRRFVLATFCTDQLKCDGTRTETRSRLSAKRTSPFESAGASVQSTTGSRGVLISGSNPGYTTFRGSVKGTGYPLHSPVSPSLPLPCVNVCHHISTGVYSSAQRLWVFSTEVPITHLVPGI